MTLILELTPEQEERLAAEAARIGVDRETYALRRLFGEKTAPESRENLADRLARHGFLGAIEGKPRPDGKNRSEIEGFG